MAMNANPQPHPFGPSPMTAQHRSLTSTPLPGMGQAGQAPGAGNPFAQAAGAAQGAITAPGTAATPGGIAQTAMKLAEEATLAAMYPGVYPYAATGRQGAPMIRPQTAGRVATPGFGKSAGHFAVGSTGRGASSLRRVMDKNATDGNALIIGLRMAAAHSSPGGLQKSARSWVKSGSVPMGMPPAPPPAMPTDQGVQGMIPPQPGAPPAGVPGGMPPGGDPAAAGAVPMDPAAAGGGGAPMPGGDPAAAGGQPPPTLNGEVPPMGMPPTPPLPANPRVNPPRQATPADFRRRQDLNSLLAMDQQVQPENTAESMQPDLLAMGSKSGSDSESAFDFLGSLAKTAALPGDDTAFMQGINAFVAHTFRKLKPWEKTAAEYDGPTPGGMLGSAVAGGAVGRVAGRGIGGMAGAMFGGLGSAALSMLSRGKFKGRLRQPAMAGVGGAIRGGMRGFGLGGSLGTAAGAVAGPTAYLQARGNEKTAAQDNGSEQHVLKRSATGESTGLSYQNKPDHYMQGQDAWESVGGYFKGGKDKKPNPFLGKHAGDVNWSERLLRLAMRRHPGTPEQAMAAFDAEYEGGFKQSSCGDELAFKRYKDMGYTDEEADRLAGQPLAKQADYDPNPQKIKRKPMKQVSALRRMRQKQQAQAEQPSISGATTQFKYAGEKIAAAPFAGKSTMPVVKPGFDTKPGAPQTPFNPGAGMLASIKPTLLQPLKMPKVPASIGAGERPKLAMDLVKEAVNWGGMGTAFTGAMTKAAPKVQSAYRAAAPVIKAAPGHIASGAKTVGNLGRKAGVGRSAMGFAGGGLTGTPDEGETLGGVGFDYGNALLGAAAFNPNVSRLTRGRGAMASAAAVPLNSIRYGIGGGFAGQMVDSAASANGYDTGGAGARWGRRAGQVVGAARGAGQAAAPYVKNMPNMGPAMSSLRSFGTQAGRGAGEFADNAFKPFLNAGTSPLRGARDFVYGAAKPGGYAAKGLEAMGAGKGAPIQSLRDFGGYVFGGAPKTVAGRLGTVAAGVTGLGYGASALNGAYNGIKQDMGEFGKEKMREGYEELAPAMAADMTHVADRYLDSAGMMDENGQAQLPRFNLRNQFGGMGQGAMQMADGIFHRLGMDPNRMSPAQKISILGGAGLLGTGAMVGSGGMAGLGALGMGGGMMMPSQGDVSPIMQLLNRAPRNEYMTQMQQTGQMPPNSNPYHGSHGPTL